MKPSIPPYSPIPALSEELMGRYPSIAIEGVIGVGKTSLAKKMAIVLNAQEVLEQAGENPFLKKYYEQNAGYALATQLFFFYQRLDQLQELGKNMAKPAPRVVSDYIFERNELFARVSLNSEEFALYQRATLGQTPTLWRQPDLVIWLQADVPTLYERIQKRGLAIERKINESYLEQLNKGYAELFQSYSKAPVFAINTGTFNPIDDEEHFSVLLEKLVNFRGGREFFNPQM